MTPRPSRQVRRSTTRQAAPSSRANRRASSASALTALILPSAVRYLGDGRRQIGADALAQPTVRFDDLHQLDDLQINASIEFATAEQALLAPTAELLLDDAADEAAKTQRSAARAAARNCALPALSR